MIFDDEVGYLGMDFDLNLVKSEVF